MKKLLWLVFLWGGLISAGWAKEIKIGVLDLQKVVHSSKAGQEAMSKLQSKFEKLRKQLEGKRQEIEAYKAELEKKASLLSEEARLEKQRELQKMIREFRAQQEDAQFEMKEAEKKALQPIFKDLEKVIKKMAQEEGYDLILEKNMPGLYWVSPEMDITSQVVQRYDQYRASQAKK